METRVFTIIALGFFGQRRALDCGLRAVHCTGVANVLITGTSRGIGLALCRAFSARGDSVIAVCRTPSAALTEIEGIRIEAGVDVAEPESVLDLAEKLSGLHLDAVINNAGVGLMDTLETVDEAELMTSFMVNSAGPLRVSRALLPNLSEGGKIAIITSRMGSLADNSSGGYYAYRMSKAAVNMAAVSLSVDLKPKGIAVALLHPGFVQTDMTNSQGDVTAAESAAGLIRQLDALTLETSGRFVHANGSQLPW